MDDLKTIVGKNLASLRKSNKMTQIELAEKFDYSDKAVSKWEQGSTMPDLETLKQLCDYYGVTLDYLTNPENIKNPHQDKTKERIVQLNRIIITFLVDSIVWMIATIIFIYPLLFQGKKESYWLVFIWAVPITALLLIFFNMLYFGRRKVITLIALSILIWTFLTSIFLHFMFFSTEGTNLAMIFVLGIPLQISIILWFMIKKQ